MYTSVFGHVADAIAREVNVVSPVLSADELRRRPEILRDVEILFGTWGMPPLEASILRHANKLKIVFLGAGSVKNVATPEFWRRGLRIVSAYQMNALPVAEFALAEILFSLKHGWRYALQMQWEQRYISKNAVVPGAYRSVVGLVSLGAIGRRVAELLRPFETEVIAYDPYCPASVAQELGVSLLPLRELFSRAHVVSLHTPALPETKGLVDRPLLESLPMGATLINTSRGCVINEADLILVLSRRADLTAVLDVTDPNPPVPGSPLFRMPNVILTPHIAGAQDRECQRLGDFIAAELLRYLRNEPLRGEISEGMTPRMA
jgi:phosphoglycerate dehydrogenase-like enzyme